ncbi:ABC transporter permease [Mycoplasmopsis bovirhinis]|uniref:ABC transporter permease n=1 Tax=Mycoplasmopsis bovirhinis TaxID=29553 RepID=UPI000BB9F49D|nr:ABC transporter permease [Mycoplasmopsis bovirhinis]BBA22247.1 ABC transporter permease [Mycoplasmopsis bovirhinis]
MWNLFKEVWRSLFKNKVTVGGLTLLIFLTSGIFTFLHGTSKTMQNQFFRYQQQSKGHDLTVDLNLPINGNTYNNGYFINGLSNDDGHEGYNQPLRYLTQNYLESSNILNFNKITENYLPLNYFIDKEEYKNRYISRSDFLDLYNTSYNDAGQGELLTLDFSKNQKYFKLKRNISLPTYIKDANVFTKEKTKTLIDKNKIFWFDKKYTLKDIGYITNTESNEVYISQLSTLFINPYNNLMTFDLLQGKEWENDKGVLKITGLELAKILGLTNIENKNFVYKVNRNISSKLINYNENEDISSLSVKQLNGSLTYNDLFGAEDKEVTSSGKITFQANASYTIPIEWAYLKTKTTYFERKLYETTYVGDNQNKWSGTYKSFMENLINVHGQIPEEYAKFSFWEKNIINEYRPYVLEGNNSILGNVSERSEEKNLLSFEEVQNTELKIAEATLQPSGINYNNFYYDGYKKIIQIEGYQNLDSKIYLNLTNKNIANDTLIKIRAGALKITKQNIYQYIANKVSKNNIGIRQTITIDSFNNGEGKKVYHFVNTGDQNNSIYGIENNINKLMNEGLYPSLNKQEDDLNDYFTTHEIDPYVAAMLLLQSSYNILPPEEYIKTDFDYDRIEYTDSETGTVTQFKRVKIYRLAHYKNNRTLDASEYNIFANLGIMIKGEAEFVVVAPVYNEAKEIVLWKNVKLNSNPNGIILNSQLSNWLTTNKLTLKAYLPKNKYVRETPDFSHTVYVPFVFRGPDVEVVNQALNENSLDLGINRLWKSIINTDLYKKGFLNEEQLLVLISSLKKTFDKNNFAATFSSGAINYAVLPKIILDGLYEVSNHPSGDYIKSILVSVFNKILALLVNYPTQEAKNQYLAQNIDNLFAFVSLLVGNKIIDYEVISSLLKVSKDLDEFLIIIRDIISAFNFKKIFGYTNDFFNNDYGKETVINGKNYRRSLSSYDIFMAIVNGIEYPILRDSLLRLLDNIHIDHLTNWKDANNPLKGILKLLPFGVKELIPQINGYKNDSKNKYKNLIDGIKFFIRNFDYDIFLETLKEEVEVETFSTDSQEYNKLLESHVNIRKDVLLTKLDSKKIIYALFKAFFNTPGSNKRVKDELIKMLNLSSKGSNIQIAQGKYLTIPDSDPDKLDFFDLIQLLLVSPKSGYTEVSQTSEQRLNTLQRVKKIIQDIEANNGKLTKAIFENLNPNFLKEYFEISDVNNLERDKSKILTKLNEWKIIIESFDLKNAGSIDTIHRSFASLNNWFIKLQPQPNSSFLNIVLNRLLSKLTGSTYTEFSYLKDIYPIIKIWLEIFNQNKDYNKALAFANELLEIANKQEIINSFNSFDLFQPASLNIAGYEETGFGVTRSLANPAAMRDLFFAKNQVGIYQNKYLKNLVVKYPEFANFLESYSYQITQSFSYIAAANKDFLVESGETFSHTNAFSSYLSILINSHLKNDAFRNNLKTLTKLFNSDYSSFSLDFLGISDAILNNVLRNMFPQLIVWTFTDTHSKKQDEEAYSNIASFIHNKLFNFETLIRNKGNFMNFLSRFDDSGKESPYLENDFSFKIAIDDNIFTKLADLVKESPERYTFFGMNLADILFASINSITGLTPVNNVLIFNKSSSYVAKVNYAFLTQNKKEIYTGVVPDDPIQATLLLNSLDEKYLLNINGSKYIIIGEDMTYDYFYPVLDENNLQVNTKDQAIVYVNNTGFDRIRQSYRGTVVKEYLTVKENKKLNNQSLRELKAEIEAYVQTQITDVTNLQRTFLTSELDGINPERSLRVNTIKKLINSVSTTSNFILTTLVILITISITFIIKRYISNKNKVIGILIAQGYTPLQIALSLSIFSFFTIIVGGLFGYISGFVLSGYGLVILSNYWVIPIQTLTFEPLSLVISLVLPLLGMAILIIFIALRSLRYKSIDLMSGITEVNIGELYNKLMLKTEKQRITTKFGISLIYNSFWKLFSFAISVILASITAIIGFSTFGTFEKAINQTYENRKFNYKLDLATPTKEGGLYNPFTSEDLDKTLYVPIGDIRELNQYQPDYFKPGVSSVVNLNDPKTNLPKNGNPTDFHPHVITQFSVNLKIDSSVSIDPFEIIYNSLPDSQKSRIMQLRDNVGFALTKHQQGVAFTKITKNGVEVDSNTIDINQTYKNGVRAFFQYIPNKEKIINGKFWYVVYNEQEGNWEHKVITTNSYRDQYREFLVKGYKWMEANTSVRDYYVSFNGLVFNKSTNETYTYLESNYNKEDIKLYGYQSNSKQIHVKTASGKNLLIAIDNAFRSSGSDINKQIPLIINNVTKQKFNLEKGSVIKLSFKNKVNRLTKNIEEKLGKSSLEDTVNDLKKTYQFYVYDINPTFINNEFIIPKAAADQIIGFDELYKAKLEKTKDNLPEGFNEHHYKFNGILSTDEFPIQLMLSTGLYSPSGFFGAVESFNIDNTSIREKKYFFDALFGNFEVNNNLQVEGVMKQLGASNQDIAKFLKPSYDPLRDSILEIYNEAKESPDLHIKEFAKLFNEQLAIPNAYSVESKTIEVGFTLSIGKTVQIIVTIISSFAFVISIIILIIVSTILIGENERNIAIWSILGYSNKEKLKMFFGIYIPFIIISLLLSFPIAYGFIAIFTGFLASSASLSIPLTISWLNVLSTVIVVFGVFILTSALSWINLNKIKAIDLLKEK